MLHNHQLPQEHLTRYTHHLLHPNNSQKINNWYHPPSSRLIGGGPNELQKQNADHKQNNLPIPSQTTTNTPTPAITVLPLNSSTTTYWRPAAYLPVNQSTHPLEQLITQGERSLIQHYCQLAPNHIIAFNTRFTSTRIITADLRDLISHNSLTNDDTIAIFSATLCNHHNIAFLCPQVLPLLSQSGWGHVEQFFASNHRRRQRSIYRPRKSREPAILIPCFVNNNHWVAVVRREINDRVLFL